MSLNDAKPVLDATALGCGIMNIPLLYTVAAAATATFTVPETARKMTVHCLGTAGAAAGATVQLYNSSTGTAYGAAFSVGGGSAVTFDVGGLNDGAGVFPDQVRIVATNITSVSFECENPETLTVS